MFYIKSVLDLFGPATPSEGQIVVYYVQYWEPYHKAVCIMKTRREPQRMTAAEVYELVARGEQNILRNIANEAQNLVNCSS